MNTFSQISPEPYGENAIRLTAAAKQDAKQRAAIARHQAQEREKADRLAAVAMPQPEPQAISFRFRKGFLDQPPRDGRRASWIKTSRKGETNQ